MKSATIINLLNRIHQKDPEVLPALIDVRVRCNKELADDPTIQVDARSGKFNVGLLGILNGIVGDEGEGVIFAVYDNEGKLTHFKQSINGGK